MTTADLELHDLPSLAGLAATPGTGDPGGAPSAPEPREDSGMALAGFIAKWTARWPEWAVAEVFVPRNQREVAEAWATLQQELGDAAWAGSDAIPGQAKLSWWQEELTGWSRGLRRHPLGLVLQRQSAPWAQLGAALTSLAESRGRPATADEAFAALTPFAAAAAAVDAALFDGGHAVSDVAVVTATLLQARFAQPGDGHVPLEVLAEGGPADPRPRWAQALDRGWPVAVAGSRARRVWAGLARARLRQTDPARPLSSWRTLLVTWSAARART